MRKPFKLLRPQHSPSNSRLPALAIKKLSKVFHVDSGFLNVLDNISFDIASGELLCILGSSGCGKTTLLNLIAGFEKPSSGTILIGDDPVTRPGIDRCVVFQEDALFPWLTVAENIIFGAKGHLSKRQLDTELEHYLEVVGMTAFKDYLPREISGGMKQRVALARVLILKPRILLMDEPFGALDAQTREEMQKLLLTLWAEFNHTIVFVTHDLVEAVTLADRVLVMESHTGQIRLEVPIPLSRPRKKESDHFHRFYRDLRNRL